MTFTPGAIRRRSFARTDAAPAEILEERIVPASLGLPQDLAGFNNNTGSWVVNVSKGSNAFSTSTWATWSPLRTWDVVLEGDFNNDGRTDVIGQTDGGWWVGLSSGTSFSTTRWGGWSDLAWQDVAVADLNGDGFDDIFARFGNTYYAALTFFDASQNRLHFDVPTRWGGTGGNTYRATFLADVTGDNQADLVVMDSLNRLLVGRSFGTTFGGAEMWTNLTDNQWPNVTWQGLTTADIGGNGAADVIGFVNGAWWLARSNGNAFAVQNLSTWAPINWQDTRIGDFDGNGVGDLAGRDPSSGFWWVTNLFLTTGPVTNRWTRWSNTVDWQDVRVGDFNGDGLDDIAGRYLGQWWVAKSNGTGFTNSNWTPSTAAFNAWNRSGWRAVATVQVNNVAAGPVAMAAARDASPDAIFWMQTNDDDDFAAALMSSVA
jgi:hypothetical protein